MIRGLRKLNKLWEILKSLFEMSEEELENTELELKNKEKVEDKPADKVEEKEEKKTDTKSKDVETQTSLVNKDKDGEDTVRMEDYKALQEELKAMKELLETTQAERVAEKRATKIKSVKDCLDYDVLTSLLDGVEDKDIDSKVEEIKGEKAYLFKAKETEGFNPAAPSTPDGVTAEFLKLNPDLRPGLNQI